MNKIEKFEQEIANLKEIIKHQEEMQTPYLDKVILKMVNEWEYLIEANQ